MRHQITYLITTIMIFAAFATSALKAQGIEGTWTQDGQYKKFSKEYKNILYTEISNDSKKLAIINDSVLRVIEIDSGKLLDSILIPLQITTVAEKRPSYAISKDFKYFAYQYNTRKESNSGNKILEDLLIFDLENDSIKIDSVVTFDLSDITANGGYFTPSQSNAYFLNNAIYYSEFDFIYTKYADSHFGNIAFTLNCATKKELPFTLPYSIKNKFQSNSNNFSLVYSYHYSSSSRYGTNYYETLNKMTNDSIQAILTRTWYQKPYFPAPETAYNFRGITSDEKYAMTFDSDNRILLYNLFATQTFKIVTQENGNTKFPELASSTVLFPNDKAGKSILLLKPHGKNLLVNKLNYETGDIPVIASGDKDYITTSKACYMIDSNKILSITKAGEFYLLDFDAITPATGIDISIDKQFCTTNDSVSFVVINPNSYTDISIDFGDGNVVNSDKIKHLYSKMGKYSIVLKAKDQYSNEVIIKKDKYITVNQGIEINIFPTITYKSNRRITIKAKVKMSGNYSDLNLYIKPANDVFQQIQTIEVDTIAGEFTGLGYYTIRVTCIDNQYNKFIIKDTVLNIFGAKSQNILKENYTNTQMGPKVHFFKNRNDFQVFYDFHESCAMIIDSNYRIINQNRYKGAAEYWSVYQLSNANYYLSMSTPQGGKFSIYDIRKPNPMDSLLWYFNQSGFGFNDDTLTTIDKGTNEIVLQSFKDITEIKRIHSNVEFKSQPLVFNDIKNKKVFLIDNSAESGITLYRVNQNYQISKINTIDAQYLPDYKVAQTLKSSQNNVFEFIDTNRVVTLSFNTGTIQKYSIPDLNIQQVVHISDTTIALLGIDSDSVINVCLVDSNYNEKERITLPYRTGTVLFAEKNKKNQLDFAARTPIGNLYFCTVKISNDTGSVIDTTNNDILFSTEVSRYPNPATNSITIDVPLSVDASILIADEKGKTIKAKIISKNELDFTIDTSLLPNGLYFVQIQDGEINKSIKFIVKR